MQFYNLFMRASRMILPLERNTANSPLLTDSGLIRPILQKGKRLSLAACSPSRNSPIASYAGINRVSKPCARLINNNSKVKSKGSHPSIHFLRLKTDTYLEFPLLTKGLAPFVRLIIASHPLPYHMGWERVAANHVH